MPRQTCALSKKSLEPHFSGKIRELQWIADKYGEYFRAGVTVQINVTVSLQIPVLSVKIKIKKEMFANLTSHK